MSGCWCVCSSTRCEEFKEFQQLVEAEEEKLLKHCATRWLSMGRCVERLLEQYEAVLSYLGAQKDADKPRSKVAIMLKTLQDPLFLPWLHFLNVALKPYYAFNVRFQVIEIAIE